jgi:hypothetical protein
MYLSILQLGPWVERSLGWYVLGLGRVCPGPDMVFAGQFLIRSRAAREFNRIQAHLDMG